MVFISFEIKCLSTEISVAGIPFHFKYCMFVLTSAITFFIRDFWNNLFSWISLFQNKSVSVNILSLILFFRCGKKCIRCQIAVHQECYGARNVRDLTSWVCKVCETPDVKRECCLCPVKGFVFFILWIK